MKKNTFGIRRILRIMIVACAFAAFAGGQAFAAEWPDGVQDNGIPAMVLTIDEKEFENVVESPDHSYSAETGSVKIYVPDGYTSEYTGDELTDSKDLSLEYIRGRGHSSWSRPKKPFKIKLNKGQNLLGMGTNKHWILLANAFDDSLIRNRLVGYMGRELGLDYTPKYVPVDFYVNDQYQGSYLLAQQIRIHETRVDIPELTAEDNEEPAVTGGYLLSLHPSDDGPDVIKTSRGVEFQAEEPSFAPGETGTAAQHDYISGFLQNLEDTIFSDTDPNDEGSACAEYMDLESAARYWWVQEFTRNIDAFRTTSTYLYKDREGKLCWGPLWDFDFSCNGTGEAAAGFKSKMEWLDWMRYFDHAYQQELQDGWEDYEPILAEITSENGMLDQYAAEIEHSWKANYLHSNPDVDPEDTETVDAAFAKAVTDLRNFLDARRAWINGNMDKLYGVYYSATFKGEGKEDVTQYYEGGTYIDPTRILKDEFQRDGYVFLGWMDEEGDLVDDSIELTGNRVFTAKYISEEEAILPSGLYFPAQEQWCSLEDSYYYLKSERTITPEKVDDDTIRWTSSDESVASLEGDWVRFNKAGTVVITGTARSGVKNSFTLHIVNGDADGDIEDFAFAQEAMTLKPGEYGQNVITFAPADKPFSTSMTYASGDESIATVNEMGVVEAKEEGICTITAEDYWSDIEKSYTLIVSKDGLLPDYTGKTVVLMSNDVHGAVAGYQYMAGLRDELKSRHADVIMVDSGDYIQGLKEVSATKGTNAIRMMNKAGYDLATLGNHEFDFSYTRLQELLSEANFKVISDNILKPDGEPAFEGSNIINIEGNDLRIGFVGITTPETQAKTGPSKLEGVTFLDDKTAPTIFSQAAEDIERLHGAGADVVFCLTHLGVDEGSAPYRSYDLWETVKEKGAEKKPDYILDGHSHTVMTEGENGEPILSTGTKFKNIGVITIDEGTRKLDRIAKPFLYEITAGSYSDPAVKAEADAIAQEIDAVYGVQVGTSEVDLNGAENAQQAAAQGGVFANGNRDGETNMGDFASDALRWYTLKDGRQYDVPEDHIIGLYNGGAMHAGIRTGNITRGDILNVFPFANSIDGIYVTGAQLLEALEASTFSYPAADAGFPHVSGMEYTIDTRTAYQPAASTYPASTYYPPAKIERISINNINGKPFSATDKYLIVTSSFIAEGGDTYGAFRGLPRIDIADLDEEMISTYIAEGLGGVIDSRYAKPAGRIHKLAPASIEGAKVVLSATSFRYNGKVRKPSIKTINGLNLKVDTDYTVKWSAKSPKNAGKYTLTVTGKGNYAGTAKATYRITKAANTLKVKGKTVRVKYKKLKGRSTALKVSKVIKFKKKGQGRKTYKLTSAKKGKTSFKKYFKINKKTGKVTVKKKLKKGTYMATVKVRAAGNANYKASAWKKVTIRIIVN